MKNSKPEIMAVVPFDQFDIVNKDGNVQDIIQYNLGGDTFGIMDLDRITIPREGLQFELPDGEFVDEFQGIIFHTAIIRRYYREAYSGEGVPPDCFSPDGINGYGEPASKCGGKCSNCPLSRFGSAEDAKGNKTKAQGCKMYRLLCTVLPNTGGVPTIINVPPTSLKRAKRYLSKDLGRLHKRYPHVITRFTLAKGKRNTELQMFYAGDVPDIDAVDAYAQSMAPSMTNAIHEMANQMNIENGEEFDPLGDIPMAEGEESQAF